VTGNYDVNEIVRLFMANKLEGRAELVREFTAHLRDSRALRDLTIEIGGHCVDNQQSPTQVLQQGLMYGMVLGIYLEDQRRKRLRRVS
jgi:hypothetical protein